MNKPIYITKPDFPDLEKIIPYLEDIKSSGVLTNRGNIHNDFEAKLSDYLDIENISIMSSGSLALILALKASKLKGEVITSPFTSVATIQALHWNNLTPVFVDISEYDYNINPSAIEKAISDKTVAILPIHVYGNPCRIEEIQKIANHYNLKVIYDAAHTFGAKYRGKSLCSYGDLSIISFHATKVFNTLEGGAVICHTKKMKNLLDYLSNTGIKSEKEIAGYGLNAKMNELQAAIGIIQLDEVDVYIRNRKKRSEYYRSELLQVHEISMPLLNEDCESNYSYFPISINKVNKKSREGLIRKFNSENIFPRRYFYPLVSSFKTFSNCPSRDLSVAKKLSESVLCLPLSNSINESEQNAIISIIRNYFK